MRRRLLNPSLACRSLVFCAGAVLAAQAQPPGGHPPGGHPPGFPPAGGGPAYAPGGIGGNAGSSAISPANLARGGVKLGPPGRWWDDRGFVQSLGLSHDQQKKMDAIFNASKPALIETYKNFEKQQSALQAIGKDPNVDKSRLFAAIDSVNQARSALEKANTEMLLQIRAQLDSGQAAKLEKLP